VVEATQLRARGGIKHPRAAVAAARSNAGTVGAKPRRPHRAVVVEATQLRARGGVKHPRTAVVAARSNAGTVGAKLNAW
jgi:hypothetical protein